MAHEDVDRLLDDIDSLVDWQLEGGDRSDSFHGEQMRENQPCPWCPQSWHYLAITERMEEMRLGSYGRDEFGYGIFDPDYRYSDDTSAILCPGSEVHGPRDKFGTWDKQRRERAQERSTGASGSRYPDAPLPDIGLGRRRTLRFHGPFTGWTVSLDEEREIEDILSDPTSVGLPGVRRRVPVFRRVIYKATFEANHPIRNPSVEWVARNYGYVDRQEVLGGEWFFYMEPVSFCFAQFTVHADNPDQLEPSWVEFTMAEELPSWFANMWVWSGPDDAPHLHPRTDPPGHECCDRCNEEGHCACGGNRHILIRHGQGHEPDCVIIDEAYEFNNERLRQHVEEAQQVTRNLAAQCATPETLLLPWSGPGDER